MLQKMCVSPLTLTWWSSAVEFWLTNNPYRNLWETGPYRPQQEAWAALATPFEVCFTEHCSATFDVPSAAGWQHQQRHCCFYSDACCSAWEGTGLGVRKHVCQTAFQIYPHWLSSWLLFRAALFLICVTAASLLFRSSGFNSKSKHLLFCFDSGNSTHLADCF